MTLLQSPKITRLTNVDFLDSNRFAALCSNEPAPGIKEEQESTLPLRRERPIASSPRVDKIPISHVSLSCASLSSGRTSVPMLASQRPVPSTRIEPSQQLSAPTVASIPRTKLQTHPSPLGLQAEDQFVGPSSPSSAANRVSPGFNTAAPYLSLISPQEPAQPTLPLLPIPPDPLLIPCLATLPIHPSFDFNSLTSPKSSGPKSRQLAPPIPTNSDIFNHDDPMCYIVKTASGKIFSIAAEIAAANTKSTTRPVGNVLIPGPASEYGVVKGKVDRSMLGRRRGERVSLWEETELESEEEEEKGEEWLGEEEGFVSTLFESCLPL